MWQASAPVSNESIRSWGNTYNSTTILANDISLWMVVHTSIVTEFIFWGQILLALIHGIIYLVLEN